MRLKKIPESLWIDLLNLDSPPPGDGEIVPALCAELEEILIPPIEAGKVIPRRTARDGEGNKAIVGEIGGIGDTCGGLGRHVSGQSSLVPCLRKQH